MSLSADDLKQTFKDRLTSRKFIITVWVHAVSCLLLFLGQLPPAEWVQLNTYLVGIYAGANAASKFGEAMKDRAKAEAYRVTEE
jgi:hypothetical protein